MNSYKIPLKVSSPKGKRVYARVTHITAVMSSIEVLYNIPKALADEDVVKNGRITMKYEKKNHSKIVAAVTQYLIDLFAAGLSKDENTTDTSVSRANSGTGSEECSDTGSTTAVEGEDPSTIHDC